MLPVCVYMAPLLFTSLKRVESVSCSKPMPSTLDPHPSCLLPCPFLWSQYPLPRIYMPSSMYMLVVFTEDPCYPTLSFKAECGTIRTRKQAHYSSEFLRAVYIPLAIPLIFKSQRQWHALRGPLRSTAQYKNIAYVTIAYIQIPSLGMRHAAIRL